MAQSRSVVGGGGGCEFSTSCSGYYPFVNFRSWICCDFARPIQLWQVKKRNFLPHPPFECQVNGFFFADKTAKFTTKEPGRGRVEGAESTHIGK